MGMCQSQSTSERWWQWNSAKSYGRQRKWSKKKRKECVDDDKNGTDNVQKVWTTRKCCPVARSGGLCVVWLVEEREREREEELLKELSVPFALSRRTLFLQLRLPRLYRPPLLQNLPTPPTHTHPSPSTVPPSTLSRLLLLLVSSVVVCAVPPPSKKKKKRKIIKGRPSLAGSRQ